MLSNMNSLTVAIVAVAVVTVCLSSVSRAFPASTSAPSPSSSLLPTTDSSDAPITTTPPSTAGPVVQCPASSGGFFLPPPFTVPLCSVQYFVGKMLKKYIKNNQAAGDPISDTNLKSHLTATVLCQGPFYRQLSTYHNLLKKLRTLYTTDGQTYRGVLRNSYQAIRFLQLMMQDECQASQPPANNCSAIAGQWDEVDVNAIHFGSVNDVHNWVSTLAKLLLQRLQPLTESVDCTGVRRRRNSDKSRQRKGKNGRRGGRTGGEGKKGSRMGRRARRQRRRQQQRKKKGAELVEEEKTAQEGMETEEAEVMGRQTTDQSAVAQGYGRQPRLGKHVTANIPDNAESASGRKRRRRMGRKRNNEKNTKERQQRRRQRKMAAKEKRRKEANKDSKSKAE